jgi:quercetin dioxygenase-like cupin family protein
VNFLNVVENPHVRVLQVTLQPGAVRRPHVHNDVTFHMLVPITGALELTVEKGSRRFTACQDRHITW